MAVAIAMVSLAGCDKIKDATSIDIEANNVKFDFSAVVEEAAEAQANAAAVMRRTAVINTFSETRTVDISELSSAELEEYANKITNVTASSPVIEVTMSPAGAYAVENLTFTAEGVANSLVVPAYTIGGEFTPPANVNTYMAAFIMKLLTAKTVEVTISGMTDAPKGTTVTISYGSDLVLKASLL